jgi:hypothetical protein
MEDNKKYYYREIDTKIFALCFKKDTIRRISCIEMINFFVIKNIFLDVKDKFINYIEDSEEISLFLDENTFKNLIKDLPKKLFEYVNIEDEITFRSFELFCDINDINSVGVNSLISQKMSEEKIPIILINSFNKSIILVNEKDYEKSIKTIMNIAVHQ